MQGSTCDIWPVSSTYNTGQDVRHLAGELEDDDRRRDGVRHAGRQCRRADDGVAARHDEGAADTAGEPDSHALAHQPPERRACAHSSGHTAVHGLTLHTAAATQRRPRVNAAHSSLT